MSVKNVKSQQELLPRIEVKTITAEEAIDMAFIKAKWAKVED